jgi:hypothetical protein
MNWQPPDLPTPAITPPPQKKSKKKALIIALICSLLVLSGVVCCSSIHYSEGPTQSDINQETADQIEYNKAATVSVNDAATAVQLTATTQAMNKDPYSQNPNSMLAVSDWYYGGGSENGCSSGTKGEYIANALPGEIISCPNQSL